MNAKTASPLQPANVQFASGGIKCSLKKPYSCMGNWLV